jgi:hypothetical protein
LRLVKLWSRHLAWLVSGALALGLAFTSSVGAGVGGQLAPHAVIQGMVDSVSVERLVGHVCKLQDDDRLAYCNELGTRFSYATASLDQAAQYVYDQFSQLGLPVVFDSFSLNGTYAKNVIAELTGSGPDKSHTYIISAHYDSISRVDPYNVAPGADDNASGSAAVLEAARVLSQYRFSRTLRFVLFAGEEQGMVGSRHYAGRASSRGDIIDGVINLDMIGFETVPPGDHIVELHADSNPASIALADAIVAAVSDYGLLLSPEKIAGSSVRASDHSSFWDNGYAAMLGIEDLQDFNLYYHSPGDTLEHIQVGLMAEFTKASVAALAQLASLVEIATPSPTATAIPSPTWTATVYPTSTPTWNSTSTPTMLLVRLYLPVVVRARVP